MITSNEFESQYDSTNNTCPENKLNTGMARNTKKMAPTQCNSLKQQNYNLTLECVIRNTNC